MNKKCLAICGACISFYIGAGFATMQEVVQYEASYGSLFPIAIISAALIYIYIYKCVFCFKWKSP
jgi:uncharacterized membrane protein YkvI